MKSNGRVFYSYIILGIALLAFAVAIVIGYFFVGLICLLAGLIIWLSVVVIGDADGHNGLIGVIMMIAGFVGGLAVFIGIGIRPNIFGGQELRAEGVALALTVSLIFMAIGLGFLGISNLEKKMAFFNKELKKFYKLYMKEDNE